MHELSSTLGKLDTGGGASMAGNAFLADDNLIAHTPWSAQGYTIASFLDAVSFRALRDTMKRIIYHIAGEAGRTIDPAMPLEKCHIALAGDEWLGRTLLRQAQFYDERIAVPLSRIVDRISDICGVPLQPKI